MPARHLAPDHLFPRARRRHVPVHAPDQTETCRLQVLRRSDHAGAPRAAGRSRRTERLRQVERDGFGALGARRVEGFRAAWRIDAGRDLQRFEHAQAGVAGCRRAGLRQLARTSRRPVVAVRGTVGQAPADAQRPVRVLHQQSARAPQGRDRPLPRYRPRSARLCDHRSGNDLAHHRGEAGRVAGVPRGGCGRHTLQGKAQGDRAPAGRYAREPGARRGHPPRTGQPDGASRESGRRRPAVPRVQRRADAQAAPAVVAAAQRGAARVRPAGARGGTGGARSRGAEHVAARPRGAPRRGPRGALHRQRRCPFDAERAVCRQRRGGASGDRDSPPA
ncbi:MAG: hypothetical protein AW07_04312 [Candidatus Accumulibacter sp. SK-11]|nr:MAG: hypothetical protein AW07_04312 [Candidatus Accumulibacter sp. SK-11]